MKSNSEAGKVIDVFHDVEAHLFTADIIKRHSTNRRDIREVALEGLNLAECGNILDLGCGFGFFTEALKGKVREDATIIGVDIVEDYRPLFLRACESAGVRGDFYPSGVSVISDFDDDSVDLAICSYSLYFFPEIVSDISRVLKNDGLLISTVHGRNNMRELIDFAKDIMQRCGILQPDESLPIEIFIGRCSSETGYGILSPWFRSIRSISYNNTLVFEPGDMYVLLEYFRFKGPFFRVNPYATMEEIFDLFEITLQTFFGHRGKTFKISKDDTIFVCSKPIQGKGPL